MLLVHTPPQILEAVDQHQRIIEGQSVNLSCPAVADPPPTVRWTRDDVNNELQSSDRHHLSADRKLLRIEKAQATDGGGYICHAGEWT